MKSVPFMGDELVDLLRDKPRHMQVRVLSWRLQMADMACSGSPCQCDHHAAIRSRMKELGR